MIISELIKILQKYPQNMEACILDNKQAAYYANGEEAGCTEGIYSKIEVSLMSGKTRLEKLFCQFYKDFGIKRPTSFYLENYRAFKRLQREEALMLCEEAVYLGVLKKELGVSCSSCNRILKRYPPDSIMAAKLNCEICEVDLDTQSLNKITLYTLENDCIASQTMEAKEPFPDRPESYKLVNTVMKDPTIHLHLERKKVINQAQPWKKKHKKY